MRVDRARVRWFEPGRVVCAVLGADPWATLASGCLLATFPQPVADVAVAALAEHFDATVLGHVETGRGVRDETGNRDRVARTRRSRTHPRTVNRLLGLANPTHERPHHPRPNRAFDGHRPIQCVAGLDAGGSNLDGDEPAVQRE
ncbi:MAG: hypothetical protein ACLPVY_15680 [Acidimicrobiia bacterium]